MVKRRWLMKEPKTEGHRDAMVEILRESDDPELLKGFISTHGAMFLEDGDGLQIYGMLIEVLYDMKPKDIKTVVLRILDQQDRDRDMGEDEEVESTTAGEYAVRCAAKYRGTFQ